MTFPQKADNKLLATAGKCAGGPAADLIMEGGGGGGGGGLITIFTSGEL